jgi:flagellar motor component MotA
MTQELAATNVWMAIIALVSLAEFLIIVAGAIVAFRVYRRATAFIDRAESEYVAPLAAKVNVVVGEGQEAVRRLQRLEERASAMVTRVEETASRVTSVAQYAWPVVGTVRAVSAAVSSFRQVPRRGTGALATRHPVAVPSRERPGPSPSA